MLKVCLDASPKCDMLKLCTQTNMQQLRGECERGCYVPLNSITLRTVLHSSIIFLKVKQCLKGGCEKVAMCLLFQLHLELFCIHPLSSWKFNSVWRVNAKGLYQLLYSIVLRTLQALTSFWVVLCIKKHINHIKVFLHHWVIGSSNSKFT